MKFLIRATTAGAVAALMSLTLIRATPSPSPDSSPTQPGRNAESPTPPDLRWERQGANQWSLRFEGSLETAPHPEGPWRVVPQAASPHRVELEGAQAFYRSRNVASDGVFANTEALSLSLEGPLQTHFEQAFAGMPDGIFPPKRLKPYFGGVVELAGRRIPAQLRVRGNSSLQECPFPKLKFKVSKEDRLGTPFAEAREIKVGTHCAEGGQGPIGRLRDERAAYREVLAYEVVQQVGLLIPKVRRAQITFHDTSPTNELDSTRWTVRRQALLLEDIEVVAERLGGQALNDSDLAALRDANFDRQHVADLLFLHALLGNWDFVLPVDGVGIWNTDVIRLPDGKHLPVPGDFDLASWVTGEVRPTYPWWYEPDLPEVDRQVRYTLEQLQGQLSPEHFKAARERYLGVMPALESLVLNAVVDDEGRVNALRNLRAFAAAVSALR